MSLVWKYVIATNRAMFEKFREMYGFEVPEDLQELVMEANAGTPSMYNIKDENGRERVLGAILSFNEGDDDNIWDAMESEEGKKYIPFAVDPFGNYFYENVLLGNIIIIDHETSEKYAISDSLDEMVRNLY